MAKQFKLSDELIEERINDYLNEHKEEILEMIDAKIATAIKKQINEIFKDEWNRKATATKYLYSKVEQEAMNEIDQLEIDKEMIRETIMKKVNAKIKKLDVQIS